MDGKTGITNLSVEELKKYKALLDEGAITEEEFQKIKAELLGVDAGKKEQVAAEVCENEPVSKDGIRKTKKARIPLIVAAAVIIVAGIVLLSRINSPRLIAKECAESYYTDWGRYASLLAYDYEGWVSKGNPSYLKEESEIFESNINSWEDFYEVVNERRVKSFEEKYGKYTVNAKVKSVKAVSIGVLLDSDKSFISSLGKRAAFDINQVDAIRFVEMKVEVNGEQDSITQNVSIHMVKIDGKWRVLTVEGLFTM